MKRIGKVYPVVLSILEEIPSSRNSDRVLMCEYYKRIGADINKPFIQLVMDCNLPPFESIRRCRQKVQETFPNLKATEEIAGQRLMNAETVSNWAVGRN